MAASAPPKKHRVPSFILFPGRAKPVGVKFEWLRIEQLVEMNVPKIIRHERAFIDCLVCDMNVIDKVAAEGRVVLDKTEGLSDNALYDGHLIFPCRYWDHGKALVDRF
jgi:hypothetical protein